MSKIIENFKSLSYGLAPEDSKEVISWINSLNNPNSLFLTPKDIFELGLRADFVILSACETFDKKPLSMKYSNSLLTSLLLNSSKQILVSLWPVEDKVTSFFITEIVRFLSLDQNKTLITAQQEAILSMIENGYNNPKQWASFIVVGS